MMIERRSFNKLGHTDYGWLDARYHFSFGKYHDENRMGFGSLRVWNDDEIASGTGFQPHPHENMEIITYVREGAITHEDSLGNSGRTVAGDVQVMSAGSGIVHSEHNREKEITRLFQIWIMPEKNGGDPFWGTKPFPKDDRSGQFIALASGFKDDVDALPIRTSARVLGATLKAGEAAEYRFDKNRLGYLVVAAGEVTVNGVKLETRDGAAISDEDIIKVSATENAELVLVDALK